MVERNAIPEITMLIFCGAEEAFGDIIHAERGAWSGEDPSSRSNSAQYRKSEKLSSLHGHWVHESSWGCSCLDESSSRNKVGRMESMLYEPACYARNGRAVEGHGREFVGKYGISTTVK